MRVRRTRCLVAVILVTLILGSTVKKVRAQSETVNFALKVSDTISLYSVSTNGFLQPIGGLPANIGLLDIGTQKEWTIPSQEDIVVSPDRQHIAFIAFNNNQVSLFIYTVGQSSVLQKTIPGLGDLQWSPAIDAILISRPDIYYGVTNIILGAYLYDLNSQNVTPVVSQVDAVYSSFRWLSNSNQVVFAGPPTGCVSQCFSLGDIYLVNRDGNGIRNLTTLASQLPNEASKNPCLLEWSPIDQRVYFVLGCWGSTDNPLHNLYSVDLNNNVSQAFPLSSLKPNTEFAYIEAIHPNLNGGGVYITSVISTRNYTTNEGTDYWQVTAVHNSASPSLVFETSFPTDSYRALYSSSIAPDGQKIVLAGYGGNTAVQEGYVTSINLSNGQVEVDLQLNEQICEIQWIDATSITYSGSNTPCAPFVAPVNTWLFDVATGTSTNISQNLGGTVYLIPLSETDIQLLPIANAGADQTINSANATLDGSGSLDPDGTIVNYSWSENGVEIATGVDPQMSLTGGVHVITLTVTDDDGAIDTDEVVITVNLSKENTSTPTVTSTMFP